MFFYPHVQFPWKSALKEFLFPSGFYLFKSKSKKKTRTKRETSEAHSEPYETSKMKLFSKILNGFHLLTIVFIIQTVFRTKSSLSQRQGFLRKTVFSYCCLYCRNYFIQMRIQNPVEHLKWSFLRKQLTAFSR